MFKAVFKEAWISFEYLIVNHTHTYNDQEYNMPFENSPVS